jgi:hypothetical protein
LEQLSNKKREANTANRKAGKERLLPDEDRLMNQAWFGPDEGKKRVRTKVNSKQK